MSSPTGLIPWFSKTKGNTYATLLHHPFLFNGKPTHAQEVAGAVGRGGAVACSSGIEDGGGVHGEKKVVWVAMGCSGCAQWAFFSVLDLGNKSIGTYIGLL